MEEIATDVSKLLNWRKATLPDWERLLDRNMILAYMDKCKQHGIAADRT